jgi:tmRNA-binding protein
VLLLLVTANIVPSLPIFVTLMTEAMHSSETSVLTRASLHNILEGSILHSHCHGNLKSYNILELFYVVTNSDLFLLQNNINNYKFIRTKNTKSNEVSGCLLQILHTEEFHNLSRCLNCKGTKIREVKIY